MYRWSSKEADLNHTACSGRTLIRACRNKCQQILMGFSVREILIEEDYFWFGLFKVVLRAFKQVSPPHFGFICIQSCELNLFLVHFCCKFILVCLFLFLYTLSNLLKFIKPLWPRGVDQIVNILLLLEPYFIYSFSQESVCVCVGVP